MFIRRTDIKKTVVLMHIQESIDMRQSDTRDWRKKRIWTRGRRHRVRVSIMHMATGQLFLLALVLRGFRLRLLLDPAESDHSDAGGIGMIGMLSKRRRTTETTLKQLRSRAHPCRIQAGWYGMRRRHGFRAQQTPWSKVGVKKKRRTRRGRREKRERRRRDSIVRMMHTRRGRSSSNNNVRPRGKTEETETYPATSGPQLNGGIIYWQDAGLCTRSARDTLTAYYSS